jgi:hypothetical protein
MRFTVICHTAVFYTDFLLFPDWGNVVLIIDNTEKSYCNRETWSSEEDRPTWRKIIIDQL